MAQYKKYALLIIGEWLLYPLKESECRDLLEIMESRYKRASTILCSQFDMPCALSIELPTIEPVTVNLDGTLVFHWKDGNESVWKG